jgi:hypothetical protein
MKIKKIPYGISDYAKIVSGNYYYVDKTPYLKALEDAGNYLIFNRPRRFGKSLFVSLMESYFSVLYKDRFEELFKGTWIYDNPTDEKHKYLVLRFNFSAVDPQQLEESFVNHVRVKVDSFLYKNIDYLDQRKTKTLQTDLPGIKSAADILSRLVELCGLLKRKLYIIIDEYDNFVNTILSTSGSVDYKNLTRGEGLLRSFFNILKGGAGRMEAPISRIFITGVSPITLDDVTSGFNIGENVSLDAAFNHMLGFTENDAGEMLNYYQSAGLIEHLPAHLMDIMKEWYGNYLFSEYARQQERLFNADMVLYFLKQYFKTRSIPNDLIDGNVRIDYEKLKHLIIMAKGPVKSTNGNFSQLKEIIEKGSTSTVIVKGFPLEKLIDPSHFKSLLFYFGLLTIDDIDKDKLRLVIPNETAKRLYYDYISEAYRDTGIFDVNLSTYSGLMTDLAYDGKWRPFFEFITGRMRESLSLRDLISGEKSIQAFLNVYLGLSNLYIIHTEKESNQGYADIFMEPFLARYEGIKYSFMLEIKYIKKGEDPKDKDIQALIKKAEEQLKQYSLDRGLAKSVGNTTLIKLVLVFSGVELKYIGPV